MKRYLFRAAILDAGAMERFPDTFAASREELETSLRKAGAWTFS